MVRIADVAELAGVSKATASRALSGRDHVAEATRKRVVEAAESLQYAPSTAAVGLATGRTRRIGVLMPTVSRWFFSQVLEGVQAALVKHGLDLMLYCALPGTPARERIFRDFMRRKRMDGLIAIGIESSDPEWERLRQIDAPIVGVVGTTPGSSLVAIDDTHAAMRATEHLLALGHREVVFLGGEARDPGAANVHRDRFTGYTRAMTAAGLGASVRHVPAPSTVPGGYAAAVDALGSQDRPTGIVGVCDEVAIGAIIAARRLGLLVPGHVSVTGIDDHEYAEMFSLTTLSQKPRAQGRAAVDLLLARIEDPSLAPSTTSLKARLIVRSSTLALDASVAAPGTRDGSHGP
ncbi:LacI family DNA-binding transcriptional regulator [Microbacterium koreense]|uniref:LacI family DNA-binding transcriptional regulator n=1 Tax=Microbacterium koreense TaxID=323761 RepID=A0ABW2ZQF8_9MICO